MTGPAPSGDTSSPLPPSWWAPGLALRERVPLPGDGRLHQDPAELPRARRRLERWRAEYGPAGAARFARRLAHADLDEDGLIGLLAEPADGLAARCPRPPWADVIERAVRAAPPAQPSPAQPSPSSPPGSPGSPPDAAEALAPPLQPLVADAVDRLARAAADAAGAAAIDPAGVCDDFGTQLAGRLGRLAARVLVLELNVARVDGRLAGSTGPERFADFLRQVGTSAGLAALFAEYPVLARLLGQTCQQAVDAHVEILARFAADRAAIRDTLLGGVDPAPLRAVRTGAGDRHRGGRSVAVLRFADGAAVVYKPRSLAMQARFTELVGWLNQATSRLELRTVGSLLRDGYGWQEFVPHRPCADTAEVERFYLRQGALLALLYAVDGTDIHYENVIACADQPVLVDVETLFHPTLLPATSTGVDPALAALASSVDRTALLPKMLLGEHSALDVSALGGDKHTTYPTDEVGWDDTGTDRMRLVRRAVEFAGSANRPRVGAVDADPGEHANSLVAGFRAGYTAIARHRDYLTGPDGPLARCADDEIRVVPRLTRTYSTLLDESTHPDVLRDGLDRDRLFDLVWTEPADDLYVALAPHEVADLWAGDVPVFVGQPRSRDLCAASGEPIPAVLTAAGLDSATAKIMAMGEADQRDQEWLINATLATRAPQPDHRARRTRPDSSTAVVPTPETLLSAACGAADEIVARARHDGRRANWLGLEPVDGRHWAVLPLGAGLANGYCGVALFLAQVGALTGITRYTDLARKAVRPVPRLLDGLAADPELVRAVGSGGFLGLGGICYALARLATLLDDAEVGQWVEAALRLVPTADSGPTSVAAGRAGGLAAMLAVHAETKLEQAGELAEQFAARLVAPPADADAGGGTDWLPTTGFLWGPTGVGWALRRWAGAGGGDRYADAALAALDRDPGLGARLAEPGTTDHGWCSGLAGALLARWPDAAAGPGRPADLDRCVRALANRPFLRDSSLCHGELGATEALVVLARHGHDPARAACRRRAAVLLGLLAQFGPECGTPGGVSCPGLLSGLAGLGYGLLRLGFADRVPSVLLLEPSP